MCVGYHLVFAIPQNIYVYALYQPCGIEVTKLKYM
jgi:hypothetical protein